MDSTVKSLVEADIAEVCHSNFPSIHLYVLHMDTHTCILGYACTQYRVYMITCLSLFSFFNLDLLRSRGRRKKRNSEFRLFLGAVRGTICRKWKKKL
jgi:hypothetical protein